jgi:pimeloyl-ACP methyl ester carboxylesterase
MSVLLDYSNPSGRRIVVHVTRIAVSDANHRPLAGVAERALFWFNGGPNFTPMGAELTNPYFEVLTIQPRGLQWSTPLECIPGDNGNTAPTLLNIDSCARNIKSSFPDGGSLQFTVTNHARDFNELMIAYLTTEHKQTRAYVYAVSYGTIVAQRFLRLTTQTIVAVVLDSVFASFYGGFMSSDESYSAQARKVFAECDQEFHACGQYFAGIGTTASSSLRSVAQQFNVGKGTAVDCALAAGVNEPNISHFRNVLVTQAGIPTALPVMIGAVFRLARCNQDDVQDLRNFADLHQKFQVGPHPEQFHWPGSPLQCNVYFGDLWSQTRPVLTQEGACRCTRSMSP